MRIAMRYGTYILVDREPNQETGALGESEWAELNKDHLHVIEEQLRLYDRELAWKGLAKSRIEKLQRERAAWQAALDKFQAAVHRLNAGEGPDL